jgi:hypothetical protein
VVAADYPVGFPLLDDIPAGLHPALGAEMGAAIRRQLPPGAVRRGDRCWFDSFDVQQRRQAAAFRPARLVRDEERKG